ncbi:MAG: GWxTD domain-containing protein [Candidatus Aminicenantes bacterium]
MKGKLLSILLIVSLSITLSLFSAQVKNLSEEHKKWLEEEVVYIISPAEKDVFLQLETDRERDLFIEEFWRQRDPTPGTQRNELREEHYSRIDFANKIFGRGTPVEGWRTDRGKFYIMLGPPDNVQKYSTFDIHPIEIWYYTGKPELGQEPNFRLTFFKRGGVGVYELYNPMRDGPKDLVPHHERYPDIASFDDQGGMSLDPGTAAEIQEMSRSADPRDIQAYLILKGNAGHELADASLSNFPGRKGYTYRLPSAIFIKEVETYPTKKLDEDYAYEFLEHKATVDVSYSVHYIGNQSKVDVLQHPSGLFFVNYTIVPENLAVDFYKDKYFTNLRASLRVTDSKDKTIFQMERNIPIELKKEELEAIGKRPFHLYDSFPIISGNFTFNLLLENTVTKEFTSFETQLRVPPPEQLQISTLILARNIKKDLPQGRIHRAYQVGNMQIYPTLRNMFLGKDKLHLFFQIYNLTPELREEGILKYTFFRQGQTPLNFEKKVGEYPSSRDFLEEISLEGLEPGRYAIRVSLFDKREKELFSESQEFRITEETLPGSWISAQTSPPPDDPFYSNILGIQYLNKGERDKALNELSDAYEREPESLDYALDYCRALLITKKYQKVRDILTPFEQAKHEDFDLFYYLGEASKEIKQYEEAIYYYQNALSIRGSVVEILNSIGSCYMELGNREEARRAWEKSLEINPNQEKIKDLIERLKKK